MSHLLEVSDLEVSFYTYYGEVQAVRGVQFNIEEGGTLGIVGQCGAGKSVTTRATMQLLDDRKRRIKNGQIQWEGDDLVSKNEKAKQKIRGKDISMISQDPM